MLLQPAWLPCQIRNVSGNGGGLLLGYMPIVGCKHSFKNILTMIWIQIEDPSDPISCSVIEKEEFAHFKR